MYQITSASGQVTRFQYDGADLIAEYDGSGQLLRQYVHGAGVDAPVVWYEGSATNNSTRRYLIPDERGSIALVTNNSGGVIEQNKYDAYGIPDPANLGRFQYTGQIWLDDVGLYHYKARAYDPVLGRFLQTDPIGYGDGLNMYAYVGNDPVNASDPSGMLTTALIPRPNIGPNGEGVQEYGQSLRDGAPLVANISADFTPIVGSIKGVIDFVKEPSLIGAVGILPFGKLARGADYLDEAATLVRKPDFVVTPNGTAVPTSQSQMREGFKAAGFPARSTLDKNLQNNGMGHILPDGTDVRTMNSTPYSGPRASFQRPDGTRVTPDGIVPHAPRDLSAAEKRRYVMKRTHVDQFNDD